MATFEEDDDIGGYVVEDDGVPTTSSIEQVCMVHWTWKQTAL